MYEKCYGPSLKLGVLHFYVNLTQNLISPPCVFNTGFISCPDKTTTQEHIKKKEFCTWWNLVIDLAGKTGFSRKGDCSLCAHLYGKGKMYLKEKLWIHVGDTTASEASHLGA